MGRLTVAGIKALTEPGRYSDGDILFLNIAPGGSKSRIRRLTINGLRRDLGLGGFPLVGLAQAGEIAFENRRLAPARVENPLAAKRKAQMPTFRHAAEQTFESLKPRWGSAKVASNCRQIAPVPRDHAAYPYMRDEDGDGWVCE